MLVGFTLYGVLLLLFQGFVALNQVKWFVLMTDFTA
jgi:hypothetical protein